MTGVFCAIDAADLASALEMVRVLRRMPIGIKIGLELFTAEGPGCLRALRQEAGPNAKIFLDLKLHDIPNTVAGALRAAVLCQPDFITLHTSGGREMMRAAVAAVNEAAQKNALPVPKLLGVTVLTHLDDRDLGEIGQKTPAAEQVLRLATLAAESGLQGVVCSPQEIAVLRKHLPADMLLVVPGIRPAGSGSQDQKRIMTPAEAAKLGADYLVIGRPITQNPDPAAAAGEILQSLQA